MSYSFKVTAKSKQGLKEAAAVEIAKVVSSQPAHAKDNLAMIKTCNAFTDYIEKELGDDESYALNANGYVSWVAEGGVTSASITVQTGIVKDN
jgi:hypothetical protein